MTKHLLPAERDSTYVQSLDRGLAVIRAFDHDHSRLTLSEVARAAGLTRATARRFLHTLVKLGYVRIDNREFSLTPRVLQLGYAYLSGLSLPEVAQPHLEELSARLDASSSVSVLDGDDVVYIARRPTKRIMAVVISVGTRFPAYATSMGRVLLAHRPAAEFDAYCDRVQLEPLTAHTVKTVRQLRKAVTAVRDQGWCLIDQELEDGLRSAGVPVRDRNGATIAAMNVSVSAGQVTLEQLETTYVPALLDAAARIEHDLGGRSRHLA
jgi:IclR family pca regulon transcriptional regulator